jgi:hypothetical protein
MPSTKKIFAESRARHSITHDSLTEAVSKEISFYFWVELFSYAKGTLIRSRFPILLFF